MKNPTIILALCSLLAACGNDDEARKTENYPTYDTTKAPDHINDSVSNGGMRSGGELEHVLDKDSGGH